MQRVLRSVIAIMWLTILTYSIVVAVVCTVSAVLLRLQPLGAKPGPVNRLAGLTIGRGFRLIQRWHLTGARQLVTATVVSWALWTILGALTIAIVTPGYDPARMWLVYGLLCAIVGSVIGFIVAFAGSAYYAKATRMSTFEGAAGYFVMFMSLMGGGVGAAVLGIGMAMFFYQQGH